MAKAKNMGDLTPDDVVCVLTAAMQSLRDGIDPEVPVQRILMLLAIAANPNIPQYEVGRHVKGMGEASISRNVTDLSSLNRSRRPGPGLVEQRADPMYRRRNLLKLTPKGRALMDEVTRRVNAALARERAVA